MVPGSHPATPGFPPAGVHPPGLLGLGDAESLAVMLRGLMVFLQCGSYMSLSLPFLATGVTWTTRSSSQLRTPSVSSPSTVCLLRNLPGPPIKVGRTIKAHPPVHQGLGQPWVPSIPSHSPTAQPAPDSLTLLASSHPVNFCVYVCVCMCSYTCVFVHTCTWRAEIKVGCLPKLFFAFFPFFSFFFLIETGSLAEPWACQLS